VSGNHELVERFIATLEARDWDSWAGLLHPDVIYELPQTRERIRGRDRYLQFNQEYPGDWHLRPKTVIADERHGVVWFEWKLDDDTDDAMAFFEFTHGLITRVTDFWPEAYEPPPGREHLVERWLAGSWPVAQIHDAVGEKVLVHQAERFPDPVGEHGGTAADQDRRHEQLILVH
jgi:ketosteroid isomerase-like protein